MYKKEFYPQPIYREKRRNHLYTFVSQTQFSELKALKEGISYIIKVHKSVGFGSATSSLSSISRHLTQRHPEKAAVADAHLRCAQLLEVVTEVVTVDTLHGRG